MKGDEWLNKLKPGDSVIVPGRWASDTRLVKVERLTATQIVLSCGDRFRRVDGRSVTVSAWHSTWLQEATPGAVHEHRMAQARRWLRDVKWSTVPPDVIDQVVALVRAATKEPK